MNVNDGFVYAYSSQNDAMDSNGNMKLNGGYVFAVTTKGSPEVALDANTESGYKLYINSGATVVAYGGLESGYSASQSVYSMSGTAGAWNALYNGKSFIAAFKAPSSLSSFAVSAPSLSAGYKGVSVSGTTYCNGIFPPMHTFINNLTERNFQNRTVALVENGSWNPAANKTMAAMLESCKNLTFVEPKVTIRTALNDASSAQLSALAEAIIK